MLRGREPVPLPLHDCPADPWRLVERRFSERFLPRTETLFTVANGYLGLRGNEEEGRPAHDHSTLVAGFHETWPITHAEQAFALARTGQTIVDVPDAKIIKLYVDDEPLLTGLRDRYQVLSDDVGLRASELVEWRRAARAVHVLYDDRRGNDPQDAHLLDRSGTSTRPRRRSTRCSCTSTRS